MSTYICVDVVYGKICESLVNTSLLPDKLLSFSNVLLFCVFFSNTNKVAISPKLNDPNLKLLPSEYVNDLHEIDLKYNELDLTM